MIHTARLLLPFEVNKIIHINNVGDVVLARLLRNKKTLHHIREGLALIDPQYDVLVPYMVDDAEKQLKRYIQYKHGTDINMSDLRSSSRKYYLNLYNYGSPADVLKRWGMMVTYDQILDLDDLKTALRPFKTPDGYKVPSSHRREYRAVHRLAKRNGKSVEELLNSL